MAASPERVRVETGEGGRLKLAGALTFATAGQALAEATTAVQATRPTHLDLSGLKTVDSAGLACVLALVAEARGLGCVLQVEGVPEGMRALARVSDVEPLLDVTAVA